jgi:hypothetical protein
MAKMIASRAINPGTKNGRVIVEGLIGTIRRVLTPYLLYYNHTRTRPSGKPSSAPGRADSVGLHHQYARI